MCVCVSCQSPLFLAASCSDPGVCSTSFLRCHNLGQASFMSPCFMKSAVYDYVFWPAVSTLYQSAYRTCACAGAGESAHGKWDIVPLCCCVLMRSTAWHLGGQRQIRHSVTFPHCDDDACEKRVTDQPVSAHYLFAFFPASFIRPTWPDFVLRHWYQTRGDEVKSAGSDTNETNKKEKLRSWLCGYHFSIADETSVFLQHRGTCQLPIWLLLFWPLKSDYWPLVILLLKSLFRCFVIWMKTESVVHCDVTQWGYRNSCPFVYSYMLPTHSLV